jgi:ubiquitin-large subunit ribosomal protein L40e
MLNEQNRTAKQQICVCEGEDFRSEPPEDLVCPITHEPFDWPVEAADGHSYEWSALREWVARNPTSPMTRQPMTEVPNPCFASELHKRAREWRKENALKMQVFVKSAAGWTETIDVARSGSCTIGCIMRSVEARTGIPCNRQRLIFAGKQVEERHTTAQYGIKIEDTLHIFLRLRGD